MGRYIIEEECTILSGDDCESICRKIAKFINGFSTLLKCDLECLKDDEYAVLISFDGYSLKIGWGYYVDYDENSVKKGIFYDLGGRRYGGGEWSEVDISKLIFAFTPTKYGYVCELFGKDKEKMCAMILGEREGKSGVYILIDERDVSGGGNDGDKYNTVGTVEPLADGIVSGIMGTAEEIKETEEV